MQYSSARKCVVPASIAIVLILQGCRDDPTGSATTYPVDVEPEVAEVLVPLKLNLPRPGFHRPMYGLPEEPNVEKPGGERSVFMVPPGTENLAAYRPVTSNEAIPVTGDLGMVTDNDKRSYDGYVLGLGVGFDQNMVIRPQWVQIDLEQCAPIYAIAVWHDWSLTSHYTVVRDVIVHVSNDPEFCRDIRTLFNNDHDNSSGMGRGKDRGYAETHQGKLIDACGVRARYMRLYSRGSSRDDMNRYVEVAVYGLGLAKSPPRPQPVKLPPEWRADTLRQAAFAGDATAAAKFLRQGASPDLVDWLSKDTPLHLASRYGHNDVAKLLLANCADPNAQDSLGRTPLHIAAYSNNVPLVEMLLENDARVDITDNKQFQALQGAVECPAAVCLLLSCGTESNAQDASGRTALYRAAFPGNAQTVALLLSDGAEVNHTTSRGETPPHWAAEAGQPAIIRKLLAAGALVNAKNYYGLTPLDHAINGGHRCSAEFLRRSGGKTGGDAKAPGALKAKLTDTWKH